MFVKVGDDQYALEQLNRFENGKVLCYDAVHSRNQYGYLVGLKFSQKPKWRKFFPEAVEIPASEFDAEWNKAIETGEWANR